MDHNKSPSIFVDPLLKTIKESYKNLTKIIDLKVDVGQIGGY